MTHGTVLSFNDAEGYGFIKQENGGPDVFVSQREIVSEGFRTLAEGQQVEFEIVEGPKGLSAQQVRPIV